MDMSEILGNIYDRSVAIVFGTVVFGTVFFSTFWRLWKTCFLTKSFQNPILTFSLYPKKGRTVSIKTSITQAWLVVESYPIPHWVTFLIICRLVYDIPSHLNGLILVWRTLLQLCSKVSHQNSRVVYEIIPFLNQVVSVIQFSDILIIIELFYGTEKKGRVQLGMYILSHFVFQRIQKFTLNLGRSKVL